MVSAPGLQVYKVNVVALDAPRTPLGDGIQNGRMMAHVEVVSPMNARY